jgi:hypothetical protein
VEASGIEDTRGFARRWPFPTEEARRSGALVIDCRRVVSPSFDKLLVGCLERGDRESADRTLGEVDILEAIPAILAGGEVESVGEDANEDLPSSHGSLLVVVRGWSLLCGGMREGLVVSRSRSILLVSTLSFTGGSIGFLSEELAGAVRNVQCPKFGGARIGVANAKAKTPSGSICAPE